MALNLSIINILDQTTLLQEDGLYIIECLAVLLTSIYQ
jgi:hypothetical protein